MAYFFILQIITGNDIKNSLIQQQRQHQIGSTDIWYNFEELLKEVNRIMSSAWYWCKQPDIDVNSNKLLEQIVKDFCLYNFYHFCCTMQQPFNLNKLSFVADYSNIYMIYSNAYWADYLPLPSTKYPGKWNLVLGYP